MRAYISAKPDNTIWIKSLREELFRIREAPNYYQRKNPHITIVPPFSLNEDNVSDLKRAIDKVDLQGREISINGLSTYSNIHNPSVVMLNIDVDIEDEREMLMEEASQYANGNIPDPVNPHITLLKSYADRKEFPYSLKRRLQREIMERNSFVDSKIGKIDVILKS